MIRIDRSGTHPPATFLTDGESDLVRLRSLITRRPLVSKDFDSGIYCSNEIKALLWQMQSRKCCYCEREYERKFSDVEHFRPKTEAVRADGRKEAGYWWLAYRFDNLYFACPSCNRGKRAKFPLASGSRALAAEEDPRAVPELPLLLDPGFDEVEEHLTFAWIPSRGFQIAPRNASERGRWTIETLQLDRDDLTELRTFYYQRTLLPLIQRFGTARRQGDSQALALCAAEAAGLTLPEAPFSLLARVALREAELLAGDP